MSRDLDFCGWWEGDVIYTCDCPGCTSSESFIFNDEEEAYSPEYGKILRNRKGWIMTKVNGEWKDFCCEECRNKFIRLNTR